MLSGPVRAFRVPQRDHLRHRCRRLWRHWARTPVQQRRDLQPDHLLLADRCPPSHSLLLPCSKVPGIEVALRERSRDARGYKPASSRDWRQLLVMVRYRRSLPILHASLPLQGTSLKRSPYLPGFLTFLCFTVVDALQLHPLRRARLGVDHLPHRHLLLAATAKGRHQPRLVGQHRLAEHSRRHGRAFLHVGAGRNLRAHKLVIVYFGFFLFPDCRILDSRSLISSSFLPPSSFLPLSSFLPPSMSCNETGRMASWSWPAHAATFIIIPELTINNYPLTIHDHPLHHFSREHVRAFFFVPHSAFRTNSFRFMQCAFVKTDSNGRHALLNVNIFVYFIIMFSLGI